MVIVRHARPRNRLRRRSCEPKSDLPRSAKIGSGHRFYSGSLGRWLSSDPLEERGGLNTHVFSLNAAVGLVDPLGLSSDDKCKVYIWLGHAWAVKAQLKKYKTNDCVRHAIYACEVALWEEWTNGTLAKSMLVAKHPKITIPIGGGTPPGPSWWGTLDGGWIDGWEPWMTFVDWQLELLELVIKAAKGAADKEAADGKLGCRCGCAEIKVEVKKVDGWDAGPDIVDDRIETLGKSPHVVKVPHAKCSCTDKGEEPPTDPDMVPDK